MRLFLRLLALCAVVSSIRAANDVRVNFTLNTTDASGAPIKQGRYYWVYRPDNLPRATPVPVVVLLDGGAPAMFHRKADEAGFVVVSGSFSGNSTGTPGTVWINDNPRIVGWEDFDYVSEVINRVRASDNCGDAFLCGLSKNGHMTLAYACERPSMLRAAASIDEFMGLTSNIPTAPLPIMVFQGTLDTNVPYTMTKDTVDAWRAVNGLLSVTPVTTFEAAPLRPGKVSQATWRGGVGGTQVAFVTIIGGSHTYALPTVQTGYDFTDGIWAFFSQFLTPTGGAPKIVSQPVNNIEIAGLPASFHVVTGGSGPMAYQWQRNGEDIPGATGDWLTIPAVAAADNGAIFRAVARNDSGSATSVAARLTVTAPGEGSAAFTSQPADQATTAGQPAAFSVVATGAGLLRYQWQKNGVNIAGETGATLAIPAALLADSGATFSAVVSNAAGSVSSARATLTVAPATGAPIMLSNPARARTLVGDGGTFSVTAWSASPMSYQWQKGDFTGNMADIPGATEATYTTPPGTLADQHTLFRCVVSNAAGSVTSASEMLFVTTDPTAPNDITSPIAAAVQAGAPFQYIIISSGGTAPIAYSAGPLPAGLSVDSDSGRIWGAATETGVFAVTIKATNGVGEFSRVLSLTVTADPPSVSKDAWRLSNFGASATDPTIAGDAADPDGDGFTNLDEFNAGSNPLDAASVPAGASASPTDRKWLGRRDRSKAPSSGRRPWPKSAR